MGLRPGQAKGPATSNGGSSSPPTPAAPSASPTWFKFTATFANLQIAATTNSYTLYTMPLGCTVESCILKVTTLFAGPLISNLTLAVGLAGNLQRYSPFSDAFTGPVSGTFFQINDFLDMQSFSGTTVISLSAISTGANLSALNAGGVSVWLKVALLP